MITEIVTFELASTANLSDFSSPTASTIRTLLNTALAADGTHAAFFGQSAENPDTVIIFIDWDSTETHLRFLASPIHNHPASTIHAITKPTSLLQILHLPPIPHTLLSEQEDINITEILFFYFPSSLTPDDIISIMTTMSKLRPALENSEAKGVFEGWAEEGDVVYGNGEEEMERCKVLVSVVGWESVEAHERFVESDGFRGNREVVMGMEKFRGVEMFHTTLVKV